MATVQLSDFADMCKQISDQIDVLNTQLTDISNQLTQANTDKANLQQQLDAANQAAANVQTQIQTLTANNADLTTQLQTAQAQIQQLQAQIQADQTNLQQLQAQVQATPANVDAAILDVVTGRRAMTVLAGLHKLPAKTTDNKEVTGVWIDSGGHTAQSNPSTNTTPHGTFTWIQGTDTTPARIDFQPGGDWDDVFIYEHFTLPAKLPRYVVDIRSFSMKDTDRAVVNCVEFQQEYIWNGKVYNTGWQWNAPKKLFRYFDMNDHVWKPSGVPFVDITTTPVNIMAEFILDETAGTTTHLALTVNGVRTPLNITQPATPKTANNKYTISICQLDSDGKGDPFGLNIHNCEARYLI